MNVAVRKVQRAHGREMGTITVKVQLQHNMSLAVRCVTAVAYYLVTVADVILRVVRNTKEVSC